MTKTERLKREGLEDARLLVVKCERGHRLYECSEPDNAYCVECDTYYPLKH